MMMTRKKAIARFAQEIDGHEGAYALRVLRLLDALTPAQRSHLLDDVAYSARAHVAKGEPEVAAGYRTLSKLLRMR